MILHLSDALWQTLYEVLEDARCLDSRELTAKTNRQIERLYDKFRGDNKSEGWKITENDDFFLRDWVSYECRNPYYNKKWNKRLWSLYNHINAGMS